MIVHKILTRIWIIVRIFLICRCMVQLEDWKESDLLPDGWIFKVFYLLTCSCLFVCYFSTMYFNGKF